MARQVLPRGTPRPPPQSVPTGMQNWSLAEHPPSGTQVSPRPQSAFVWQTVTFAPAAQVLRMLQGPWVPQSASTAHSGGTPAVVSGKYCSPTPSPAEFGSRTNWVNAIRMASHFDWPDIVNSVIDDELSSMTYMSRGSFSAFCVCAAQAASPSGALPTTRPGAASVGATSVAGGPS